MTIRLDVLGAPRCCVDLRELADLPAQKTRFALLVYLAVERNVARDEVAAMFWPDSTDDRARHALSQSLYDLKRVLGEGWLDTQSGRLIVTDKLVLDADEFASLLQAGSLAEALEVYRGTFLRGFSLSNFNDFETWVDRRRAHFERLHRKARREYVEWLITQQRLSEALDASRTWVEVDPLEDEANHRFIELLIESGARTEALAAFALYEQRLRDELDVVPLDHTREMVESVRESSGSRGGAVPLILASPPAQLPPAHSVVNKAPDHRARRRYSMLGGALATFVVALALVADPWSPATHRDLGWSDRWLGLLGSRPALDSTHYAILPFTYAPNTRVRLNEVIVLHDALSRWQGISVVPPFQVREAVARERERDSRGRLNTARRLGVGRYVIGEVAMYADSIRVHAVLFDSRNGRPIVERSVKVAPNLSNATEALARLGNWLVSQGELPEKTSANPIGTRSVLAHRAFLHGQNAVMEWQLDLADSAFAEATRQDPQYSQAFLWLAQVRAWTRSNKDNWIFAAQHAAAIQSSLSARDRMLATSIAALAAEDYAKACALYRQITQIDPEGFTGWYALADCLNRDRAVIRDAQSETGFKFRSSYAEALAAYRRAFEIMPSIHKALHERSFYRLRTMLYTSGRDQRFGRSVDDTTTFRAYPTWRGDSLAFIPVRAVDVLTPAGRFDATRIEDAVKHQRRVFYEITAGWASAFPQSSEALEAVAVALEMLGNPAALDSLRQARRLSTNVEQRTRLAVNEVFLRIKFALPNDLNGLRLARVLGDSILRSESPATTKLPTLMSSLAIIFGRADLAAQYHQNALNVAQRRVPPEIGRSALALEVYAAIAGPRDSLVSLAIRLNEAIANNIAAAEQQAMRAGTFLRIAPLAVPVARFGIEPQLLLEGYPALTMTVAAAKGDVRSVLEVHRNNIEIRKQFRSADISLDALMPETWALMTIGDARGAASWLDPTLIAFRFSAPGHYATDPIMAASLVRAMVLRADIAHALGDQQVRRRWAAAIPVLWSDCDDFLKPTLRRMQHFAGS